MKRIGLLLASMLTAIIISAVISVTLNALHFEDFGNSWLLWAILVFLVFDERRA